MVDRIHGRVVLRQIAGDTGALAIGAALGTQGQSTQGTGLCAYGENANRIQENSEGVGRRGHRVTRVVRSSDNVRFYGANISDVDCTRVQALLQKPQGRHQFECGSMRLAKSSNSYRRFIICEDQKGDDFSARFTARLLTMDLGNWLRFANTKRRGTALSAHNFQLARQILAERLEHLQTALHYRVGREPDIPVALA
jgi:hypothetical protein